jgi:tripartite-type tricarboxylate transporter receptor subunit TctC
MIRTRSARIPIESRHPSTDTRVNAPTSARSTADDVAAPASGVRPGRPRFSGVRARARARVWVRAGLALMAGSGACAAFAQAQNPAVTFPVRPVRLIVPFAPAGVNDIVARLVGTRLQDRWGVPVVVDNRAGAGGNLGTERGARANPDGHTLLVGSSSTLGSNASLYAKLPFDVLRDFAPVSLIATAPYVLVTSLQFGPRTVPEFVAAARAAPERLTYSSFGEGSSAHLVAELFLARSGIRMVHVPYKGGGPALTAVLVGEVQATFANLSVALPQLQAGKVRALAVTTPQRTRSLPEAPTFTEAGVRGLETSAWVGIVAPAATPAALVRRLNADIHAVVGAAEMRAQLEARGLDPWLSTPGEFAAHLKREIGNWEGVIRSAGIRRL